MSETTEQQDGRRVAPVRKVTLFEDRAEVTRELTLELEAGTHAVTIGPLTAAVDERSLQASIAGDAPTAQVAAARVHWRLITAPEESEEAIGELEEALRDAQRHRRAMDHQRRAVYERRDRLQSLQDQWLEGLGQVPRDATDSLAGWQTAGDDLASAGMQAVEDWRAAEAAMEDAIRDEEHLRARLDMARIADPIVDATAKLQVEVEAAGEVTIELRYRTPCALWRPEHVVCLGEEGKLEITTLATMWQRTGEDWSDIEVHCSTARPSRAASPPPLEEDIIHSREKTPIERRVVHVESRELDVSSARNEGGGSADVSEMPGVDDGGEPLEFVGTERIDLPSTGQPYRVELSSITTDAVVDRVLFPERTNVAHVRAKLTHRGSLPLLAGPVRIVRNGTLVGRARLPFVAPGEPIDLGLGSDDAIRAARRETTLDDDTGMTGTRVVERSVDIYLSNLSDTARTVHIRERIPVSEIEGVKITLTEAHEFEHDAQDGFLDAEIELGPLAHEELSIRYKVKASSKIVLPF